MSEESSSEDASDSLNNCVINSLKLSSFNMSSSEEEDIDGRRNPKQIIDSDSSDTDEVVGTRVNKKRRLNSSEDGSSSSDEDDETIALEDFENVGSSDGESIDGSDSEDSERSEESYVETESSGGEGAFDIHDDDQPKRQKKPVPSKPVPKAEESSSDSGDENSDKCAICLRSITKQEVGSPECCDHVFCCVCLVEWSKNSNKCPMDRLTFTLILVKKNKNGKIVKQLPVDEPRIEEEILEQDLTFCEICGESNREDRMLLCDGCDLGYHLECLTPPLESIPDEDQWFCPDCAQAENLAESVEIYDDEVDALWEHVEMDLPTLRPRVRTATYHPMFGIRTRQLERIRRNIRDMRQRIHRVLQEMSADEFEYNISRPGTSGTQPDSSRSTRNNTTASTSTNTTASTSTNTTASTSNNTTTRKRKATTKRKPKTRTKKKVKKRRTTRKSRVVTKTETIYLTDDEGNLIKKTIKKEVKQTVKGKKRKKRKTTKKGRGRKLVKSRTKTYKRRGRACRTPKTTTPKTVKGRLAQTLGMVPSKKPGQLLPDVKVKSSERNLSSFNFNRSGAGIPTLHIFEPRDELNYFSSGSDGEDLNTNQGQTLLARPRVTSSNHHIYLKKLKLDMLSSRAAATATRPRIPTPPPDTDATNVLDSILSSQAIWHSKNSSVIVQQDGSIVTHDKPVDVRNANTDGITSQAPMFPGQPGSRPRYQAYGNNNAQENNSNFSGGSPSTGTSSFPRFGGPLRNDREGYTNYLNNAPPPGPTPYFRGGPPLRFRMQTRPPLIRRNLIPRQRQSWQGEEEEEAGDDDLWNAETVERVTPPPTKQEDEDVDIYSDIETNVDQRESESEEYPALGPPPEPPAFLLNLTSDFEAPTDLNKSEEYDPAEPCDSDEEDKDKMVIDDEHPPPPCATSPPQDDDRDTSTPNLEEGKELDTKTDETKEEEEEGKDEANLSDTNEDSNEILKDKKKKTSPEKVGVRLSFDIFGDKCSSEEEKEEESQDESEKVNLPAEDEAEPSLDVDIEKSPMSPKHENVLERDPSEEKSVSPIANSRKSRSRSSSNASQRSLVKEDRRSSVGSVKSSDSDEVEIHNKDKVDSDEEEKSNRNVDIRESTQPKVAPGLEGLDIEEVSSENEGIEFSDRSLGSLSLSDMSPQRARSPRKKKKKKKKKGKKGVEDGEIDSEKEKRNSDAAQTNEVDENSPNKKRRWSRSKSRSHSGERPILTSRENKKKSGDLSWKKPSKKDKNYREGKKRLSSKSKERRRSKSRSRSKEKKKSKDRRKKAEKKKELERYDVRKVVKNKEIRTTDEFGRDIISKSKSRSRSNSPLKARTRSPVRARSRSPVRGRSRSPVRARSPARARSRSPVRQRSRNRVRRSKSRSRSFRRFRSPVRRRSRSLSRSRSRSPKKTKKKVKGKNARSLSRGRRSRSLNRRPVRGKKKPRRSWSRSPSFSPQRSPIRTRRSVSKSWSRSPVHNREPSLEKLTVVLTKKDKRKTKKKENRRSRRDDDVRRKKSGNSKEVFASGDNILVSVNFKNNRNTTGSVSPGGRPSKKKRSASKNIVDAAFSASPAKRAKKLTRLNEKDAEIILNRKPVAVIDLDMSPYREQTPSPVNVVVVSDSGSGDEGKQPTPQRSNNTDKNQETGVDSADTQRSSPVGSYMLTSSGPKTPPEPSVKFSISKPQQLRPIVNPLGEEEEEEEEELDERSDLDRRIEKELEVAEVTHKGPNTPPEPGPNTPSPDAYDPFEPTKSRTPSPDRLDGTKNSPKPSPPKTDTVKSPTIAVEPKETATEVLTEKLDVIENGQVTPQIVPLLESPEKNKIPVVITTPAAQKAYPTVVKQLPLIVSTSNTAVVTSPAKTTGIQRLQHRLGSPVNRSSANAVSEILSSGNYSIRKQNGQPRPLQDATNETVDMVIDMDDSPYSPGSREGDDLFDPPEVSKLPPPPVYKPTMKNQHPPAKNKFDLLFGTAVVPTKTANKKKITKTAQTKNQNKTNKKGAARKGMSMKIDEDQLKILDDLPSSAVELQMKDAFLKKLNRQERVIDEVKTVLKPHYAKRHVTKDEYKDILRKAVPKICHNKSGEINPSKIQQLVEAYVKKYRYSKKKLLNTVVKPKASKKTLFS